MTFKGCCQTKTDRSRKSGFTPKSSPELTLFGHGGGSVPSEPERVMADVDTALVEQIFDVPQREWETDMHHHRGTNDLW